MPVTPGRIDVGSEFQATASFSDQDGTATDPATIVFRTRSPSGIESRYVYDTDDEIERSSAGNYIATITLGEAGKWELRWETTDPKLALKQIVYVQCSSFSEFQDDPDYV